MPKISELPSATTVAIADETPFNQGGTTKKVTFGIIRSHLEDRLRWMPYDSSEYTATPPTTQSVTVTTTEGVVVGSAIRISQGSGYLYGVVSAVVTDTTITFVGAAISTGSSITDLEIGGLGTLQQMDIIIPGVYAGSTSTTALATISRTYCRWANRQAALVNFQATQGVVDTTSQPKINVLIEGNRVSTDDSNLGIQLTTVGTWIQNVGVNTSNYIIENGEDLEIEISAAGGAGDAQDLVVTLVWVLI